MMVKKGVRILYYSTLREWRQLHFQRVEEHELPALFNDFDGMISGTQVAAEQLLLTLTGTGDVAVDCGGKYGIYVYVNLPHVVVFFSDVIDVYAVEGALEIVAVRLGIVNVVFVVAQAPSVAAVAPGPGIGN